MCIVRVPDCPKNPVLDEDADVAGERTRICRNENTNDILRIRDLSKVNCLFFPNMINIKNMLKNTEMAVYSHSNVLDWQTYKGMIIPAVNRVCLGVSAGEVGFFLLKLTTPELHCVWPKTHLFIIFCSAVLWAIGS